MGKKVTFTSKGQEALEGLKGQSKELLTYLINKYGVDTPVDQSKLVLDLNTHQYDTEVLSKESSSPISRLYEFYRSKTWAKEGWVKVEADNKGTGRVAKEPGKWKKLEANNAKLVAHAAKLEELLEKNNIQYDELVLEEDTPEDIDEDEAEESAANSPI